METYFKVGDRVEYILGKPIGLGEEFTPQQKAQVGRRGTLESVPDSENPWRSCRVIWDVDVGYTNGVMKENLRLVNEIDYQRDQEADEGADLL